MRAEINPCRDEMELSLVFVLMYNQRPERTRMPNLCIYVSIPEPKETNSGTQMMRALLMRR